MIGTQMRFNAAKKKYARDYVRTRQREINLAES